MKSISTQLIRIVQLVAVLNAALICAQPLRADAPTTAPATRRPAAAEVGALEAYRARLAGVREGIPAITAAAEAAAQRALKGESYIHYQWPKQPAFGSEFIARSGGLGNWAAASAKKPSPLNVALCTARSWEADAAEVKEQLAEFRKDGWLIILFASRAGMPEGVEFDHLIDNGATSGAASEGPVNVIVNVTNGWMWTCEFVAALTRHGKHPGVYMSAALPGEEKHNVPITQKATLFDCETKIPPGQLAGAYLKRVERLVEQLNAPETRLQVNEAADVVAGRMLAGKTIGIATCNHVLPYELFVDTHAPWKPFYVEDRGQKAWTDNMQPGGTIVWIGYIGESTKYDDFGGWMRDLKLDKVTCFVTDPTNPKNNAPDALAHIEQHWKVGDAEVEIPFPPGKMAPVSGIDQALIFRMLDEAVGARLQVGEGHGS